MTQNVPNDERLRRWRLMLGGHQENEGTGCALSAEDQEMDQALAQLYNPEDKEKNKDRVGMGASAPRVARWLGDIRKYFPRSVVQVMQKDALERLNLRQMLIQPELLQAVEPDVHLVANLLALNAVMPAAARETARMVVRKVVEDLERKLANPMRQAVSGSLNRATRNRRPRHNEIDWNRTIRANLKHYQPEYHTIIPEARIGFGRKRSALREIILCVDQSGSMATSVVYAGIFGAVLASLPALSTRVVVYDTSVVDLTAELHDPVELLFGTQLGGGNDTPRALRYCQTLVRQPPETILLLITDLYEGAGSAEMIKRLGEFLSAGVQVVCLLALNDDGAPSYEHENARHLAALGIPVFACTPDLFPDLMAAAISRQSLATWAANHNIVTTRGS
jgi:VWA domain containing CoxE-like protein